MGRELRRVPLDFDWPINEPWAGFLNPYYKAKECAACDGTGYAAAAKLWRDRWYGKTKFEPWMTGNKPFADDHPTILARANQNLKGMPDFYSKNEAPYRGEANRLAALFNSRWSHHLDAGDVAALIEAGRLHDFTHTFRPGKGWVKLDPVPIVKPEDVNRWSLSGMGHDSINCHICVNGRCEREGMPHTCPVCDGDGEVWPSRAARKLHDDWQPIQPPTGIGYQIWETVSEGAPISPVFATPEELARHMAGTRWGADEGTPYETWLAFIRGPGWAPTMIGTPKGLQTGVEAVVDHDAA